ncbi:27837_t:CDS:2 [Dentiscutata erythropus]|uniref:27837_t:CDS:1 n=1 Tax=Dentiscutata erythropus TaxID=1348616 RepID=A0A9N9DFJ5_9GLOM|nr:27837_t:CDS:2 [Dentiscutata erythropus]
MDDDDDEKALRIIRKTDADYIFQSKDKKKGIDPEFPENSLINIQKINGGKLDCIELDGDHISVNLHPICKNISNYIKQYLNLNILDTLKENVMN